VKRVLKRIGLGLAVAVVLALVAFGALYWIGGRKWSARQQVAVEPLAVPTGSEAIERGRHLALVHCANCHGEDLGGAMFVESGAFATVAASNLTTGEGGAAASYGALDWVRALRHGVNARGRAMFVMPAESYTHLSDEDLGALIAFLEQSPPVDRRWPDAKAGPVGRVLRATGALDAAFPFTYVDHHAEREPAPPPGPTAEYGAYLARTFGCQVCHGAELAGGIAAGTEDVPAGNLTPGGPLANWNEALFLEMIRTRESEHMPWRGLRAMTEDEQRAVWRFLTALPARSSALAGAAAD
jgi:mono/diheme cytochrome c family protein